MARTIAQALDRSNWGIGRPREKEASVKAEEPTTTITGRSLALMPNGGAGREPAWQRKSAAQSFGTARNRRTRTRMSGGVGAGRAILPPTRFGQKVGEHPHARTFR